MYKKRCRVDRSSFISKGISDSKGQVTVFIIVGILLVLAVTLVIFVRKEIITFKPEEIIGKQVSLLINLAPRKIRGIESQGMILMAEEPDGKLSFVSPAEAVKNGAIVK